ncbi:unnamed protein product, partial [Discosporangium mesarthrocarpum]
CKVGGCGDAGGSGSVWARVRARVMECVRSGGLDGADFTGVIRQVCVMCEAHCSCTWELKTPSGPLVQSPQVDPALLSEGPSKESKQSKEPQTREFLWARNGREGRAKQLKAEVGQGTLPWLNCLRELYAGVPESCLPTVELVLEQTLHQMPDVAEQLLQLICSNSGFGRGLQRGVCQGLGLRLGISMWPGTPPPEAVANPIPTSPNQASPNPHPQAWHDLGLLLLLFREASPLRACTLPLLPFTRDRSYQAEEGIKSLLLQAA